MKISVIIGIVAIIVIVAAGAWYVHANSQRQAGTMMASSTPNLRFGVTHGGSITGSIEVLDDNGFTITLSDGTTKDIDMTATTTLENYASASSTPTSITLDNLSVGEQVYVIGLTDSDGSISATRVLTGTPPARPTGGMMRNGSSGYTDTQ
ncbi:MAG: hypothetical protein P4M11_05865 [Candidatus Pacebacteria bacterium]|nr:hypothetical protein [Candidatus Paceibacterota bacterium]